MRRLATVPYSEKDKQMQGWSVIWDITYSCPLRCSFCYSESGRRPSRAVRGERLDAILNKLVESGISYVSLAGGEPLVHPEFRKIVHTLRAANVGVAVYTAGRVQTAEEAQWLSAQGAKVHVSIESPDPAKHDSLRGRRGAFAEALQSLQYLSLAASKNAGFEFGIESTVLRDNLSDLPALMTFAASFAGLGFITLGPAVPSGLASRVGYAERHLLSFSEFDELGAETTQARLRGNIATSARLEWFDSRAFRMGPQDSGATSKFFQMEPDGLIRAFTMYEGTVADIVADSSSVICNRVFQRRNETWIKELLSDATSMERWSHATRIIDAKFAGPREQQRVLAHGKSV